MFHRIAKLPKSQSFFLFGSRGTGKSTLIKEVFTPENSLYLDLLSAKEEDRLSRDPDQLEKQVLALPNHIKVVVIDEIQKIPKLLDIVHRLIESTDKQFVLTGSSARKLKSDGANMLAGRAFSRSLHPLTTVELGDVFDLDEVLRFGSLPQLFKYENDEDKEDFLFAYTNTYLKEEIWGEHLIRKLEPFRKFLEVAAQNNGKIVNFTKTAKIVGVDTKTIQNYFQILEDTLVGFILEPYSKSIRKRVHKNPKFYFFDPGVTRALAGLLKVRPERSTGHFGELFEQWVILECLRLEAYLRKDFKFYYYRTLEDQEIDLIIERPGKELVLIEIMSANEINEEHVKKLNRYLKHFDSAEAMVLSCDKNSKKYDQVSCYFWAEGLKYLFNLRGRGKE